jgi:pimeloyl-ACP methyl ester carboxylesterase
MPVVELGRGSTIAVFIHQTDGDGLCGFWPYANWLTDHYPVRAVLFDLCDYGQAQCPASALAENQRMQVALAVRFARAASAKRVVLIGASMGGALALASATPTHADAVVDLSGPADWLDAAAAPAAAALRVPALIAVSPGDADASYHDLHAAFTTIRAAPKKFVRGDGAHGWDLLGDTTTSPPRWHPLATTVARWITGHYA